MGDGVKVIECEDSKLVLEIWRLVVDSWMWVVVDAWWKLERTDLKQQPGKDALESEKLYAACNKANAGSLKVLLKNGFEIYEEIPLMGDTVALFSSQRPAAI